MEKNQVCRTEYWHVYDWIEKIKCGLRIADVSGIGWKKPNVAYTEVDGVRLFLLLISRTRKCRRNDEGE